MWGSILVGDDYDAPFDITDMDTQLSDICKQLALHPLLKAPPPQLGQQTTQGPAIDNPQTPSGGDGKLTPLEAPKDTPDKKIPQLAQQLQPTQPQKSVIGWFDTHFGRDAEGLVKSLKEKRRVHKSHKENIDEVIDAIRLMKKYEVEQTIDKLSWSNGYEDTICNLGLSERNLKSLQKFGETRKVSLLQACSLWDSSTARLEDLNKIDCNWNALQKESWVQALNDKDTARKQWNNCLHTIDSLTKQEAMWLHLSSEQIEKHGQMDSRSIISNLSDDGHNVRLLSAPMLGILLKTYGEEIGIVKGSKRREWMLCKIDGEIIIKDPWAYTAGFIDADGYITITKRGEPRVGLIATGERGRIHCEQLYKTLGCGVLQLDLKVHKESQRSQHRLQFYSKADIRKVLKGVLPHIRLKKNQASSVLEYIDTPRKGEIAAQRRNQLEKLVKWDNWSDKKGDELLVEWDATAEGVEAWRDPSLMRLAIEAERLVESI